MNEFETQLFRKVAAKTELCWTRCRRQGSCPGHLKKYRDEQSQDSNIYLVFTRETLTSTSSSLFDIMLRYYYFFPSCRIGKEKPAGKMSPADYYRYFEFTVNDRNLQTGVKLIVHCQVSVNDPGFEEVLGFYSRIKEQAIDKDALMKEAGKGEDRLELAKKALELL